MDKSQLESALRGWCAESTSLGITDERLPAFLAQRIVDSGLTKAEDSPDVVRANVGNGWRKIIVKGFDSVLKKLRYEFEASSGAVGMGLCNAGDVHPEDHPKLADILERMARR